MRLTVNQLRRIIKEEIGRSTVRSRRILREMAKAKYSLKIDNVSGRSADEFSQFSTYAARSPEFRSSHRRPSEEGAFIDKIDSVISEDNLLTINYEHSEADDSLSLSGSFENLKQLAKRIDPDLIDMIVAL